MSAEAFIDLSPNLLGPTWERGADGRYNIPPLTLGWEIAGWASEYLLDPNSSMHDPKPWRFTNEQLRFILWWYAVDAQGRFAYRYGVLQRLKGWGKDPLLAVVSLVELCGPSRFSHFDEDGNPVGKAHPAAWVQVAAVSREQTKNTMTMFPALMSKQFKAEYQIDEGLEIIRANGGRARLEAVTSSYRSLEGARSTFTLLNEALWIETPIPTPKGFVRMGDLEVGDMIYGRDGVPVPVTYVTEAGEGRACLKVTLPNGESIVASEGHLWMTKLAGSAALPRVRTTLEMAEDGRRFRIPRAGMRHSENTNLPLDPYVLGAWLGDGSTGDANITIGGDDIEAMVAEFVRRGVPLHEVGTRRGKTGRFSFSHRKGFGSDMGSDAAKALRGLPCYRSKHVPDEYMFAGHEQRLELLRGLMDTDGHVTKGGHCVFVGNAQLSADVAELATSLGFLPSRTFAPDSRSREGGTWRVTFLLEGENPFSLPRKRDRVAVKPRRKWVTIRIEAVPSVPVRCVEVDEENHLFQAGLSFVTHNTQHWVAGNGGIKMYNTIDGNAAKGGNRYLAITNAYLPGEDSVAERMRMAYVDILEGRSPDMGSLYDSIEAHPKTGLDPDSLRLAVPLIRGDAVWINPEDVIASVMKSDIEPARSRRMWLNQIVADEDALYEENDWDSLARPGQRLLPGDQVVLGFDGGLKDDSTALVAIRVEDSLAQALLVEEKPSDWGAKDKDAPRWEVDREAVDSAVHAAFERYDVVAFYADVALWESYVAEWASLYAPRLKVRAGENNAIAWDMRSLRRSTAGNELLMRTILDGKISHGGAVATKLNLALRRHLLNARRAESNFGLSFRKESKDSPKKVDAYAALVAAYSALNDYRQKGKKEKPRTGQVWFF